jgi:hypothetical protein
MAALFFNTKSFFKVILTLEKSRVNITAAIYRGIFITLGPGVNVKIYIFTCIDVMMQLVTVFLSEKFFLSLLKFLILKKI